MPSHARAVKILFLPHQLLLLLLLPLHSPSILRAWHTWPVLLLLLLRMMMMMMMML